MDIKSIHEKFEADRDWEVTTQVYHDSDYGLINVVVFDLTGLYPQVEFKAHPASNHAMMAFETLRLALRYLRKMSFKA